MQPQYPIGIPNMIHPKIRLLLAVAGLALCATPSTHAQSNQLKLRNTTLDQSRPSQPLASTLRAESRRFAPSSTHMLAQFNDTMSPTLRQELQNAGISPLHYVGNNTWIVSTTNATQRSTASLKNIRWHSRIDPDWKLSPGIATTPVSSDLRKAIRRDDECLVQIGLMSDASLNDTAQTINAINGAFVLEATSTSRMSSMTALLPTSALKRVAALDAVMYIEHCPEAAVRNQTARAIVQSATTTQYPIHNQGITGINQIIGVIDTRMDVFHCSLVDPLETVVPGVLNAAHRKILAFNDSSILSPQIHGTHVSTIAAGDDGTTGNLRGNAYDAKLVYDSIPGSSDQSVGTSLRTKLDLHHAQGARIHTNSWGTDSTTAYNGWCNQIDSFSYDNEDSLVIFAATNNPTLKNPENAKNVLAVTQTNDTTTVGGTIGLFQKFGGGGEGPTADGRRKPDILAPGTSIISASTVARNGLGEITDDCTIRTLTGTSMAAPAIAGAAAMTRQYFIDGFYPTGAADAANTLTPTGALMRAIITNSGADITQIDSFLGRSVTGYPTDTEGWGRVNLDQPLFFTGDARTLIVHDVRNTDALALNTNDVATRTFVVNSSNEQLRVTLAFTDVEGVPFSATPVVNNIDLEVEGPLGVVFLGNDFNVALGTSTTGGAADPLNNIEQVHISAPITGIYTVRIKGTAVNFAKQGYALVITGDVSQNLPADFTGDGFVDGADLGFLLGAWGTPNADLNNDGTTDGADLGILLGSWS